MNIAKFCIYNFLAEPKNRIEELREIRITEHSIFGVN